MCNNSKLNVPHAVGLLLSSGALLFYTLAFFKLSCPEQFPDCECPYKKLDDTNVQIMLAGHVCTVVFLLPSIILFGVALCKKDCQIVCGFLSALLVFLSLTAIMGLFTAAFGSDKYGLDLDPWKIKNIMFWLGFMFTFAALIAAILATVCKDTERTTFERY
ncbi:uncharacterized protein LOC142340879 [Convolutriloba macropyga]|uniref:uncharacterized protein LOC142340879 n=1 Tax=Convolutriloba macropyga TaxID=536237 RepID=UPI003F51B109